MITKVRRLGEYICNVQFAKLFARFIYITHCVQCVHTYYIGYLILQNGTYNICVVYNVHSVQCKCLTDYTPKLHASFVTVYK